LKRKENALALLLGSFVGSKPLGRADVRKFNESNMLERQFSIAPMMEWTDRAEKRSLIST
jgi:hypothetical protein